MSLSRFYNVWDMGFVPDEVATYDGTFYYTYTNEPAWFNKELISAGRWFPSFSFTPPLGTSGQFTITVVEYYAATDIMNSSGFITINVQAFASIGSTPWVVDHCHTANLVWLDPSGGWESYLFIGKQQGFQDAGKASTFVNADREKRYSRKDEIYQGVIISTGNIPVEHVEFIADQFKSIQLYLWETGSVFTPIIIKPSTFKKVKVGQPFEKYEFEFRHAVADVIQTQ